ncbi:hypothetical protein N9478_07350 [Gammaproteobacteria bacterium]|nr:hypothetical protein [Gammaproteobacteria bacterium]
MKNKTLMILLGIIAVNLTIQTVKDVGLFPTAYAQDDVQKVAICSESGFQCASMSINRIGDDGPSWALTVSDVSDMPL